LASEPDCRSARSRRARATATVLHDIGQAEAPLPRCRVLGRRSQGRVHGADKLARETRANVANAGAQGLAANRRASGGHAHASGVLQHVPSVREASVDVVHEALDRGVFMLSLDFELIWGTLDLFGPEGFRRACTTERQLLPRLLELLARHRIGATWCVVGHLFLERCPEAAQPMHAEMVRPRHAWQRGDWFADDPGGDERTQPLFFARSLVRQIQDCPVPQEIGSHSFSHVIFGDPGCSRECADSELRACVKAARELGIELRSFAFPRNSVGHLDVLRAHAFTSFRGPGPRWYEQEEPPGPEARLARLWDVLLATTPPVFLPRLTGDGLWDLPGSMIYQPMHGLRRHIPLSLRVRRARKGLEAAAHQRRLFHLWFHPTNLADESDAMFDGLDQILREVAALCAAGRLENLTMGEFTSRLAAGSRSS